nr:hypothetical protein [Staphylococcus massiliensis]
MLASDVVCYKMDKSRKSQILSREELLDLFKTRLEEVEKSDLSWSFDVIHRARLENEQLILFYVYANDFTDHQKRH